MEAEKIIDDLCLIDNVVVNYSQGRRRGLTDEETEDRALKAVSLAMERLEKTKTNKHTREELYIALSELDFSWYPNEVEQVAQMWRDGIHIADIAEKMKRDIFSTSIS